MIGPLSSQLNAIKWGEFSYETIYELQKTTKLLSKKDCVENGKIPLFTSDSKNNGIVGYVNCKPSYKLKNNQCMVVFGDHTRTFNIAKNDFCIADNVKVLKPIKDFSIRILLFINTMWGKKIIDKGYARHWSLAKTAKIQLPLKPTANAQTLEDIDFTFMEKFIAELEQCRLAELEAYLKATGLSNTTLSNDEENALNLFNDKNSGGNTPCGLTWQSFRLGDLFEIRPTKAYKLTNSHLFDSNAKNPVVTNSSLNNGISGYSSLEPTEKGNQITYSDTTTSEGIFYQKRPFIGYSHVQGLYPLKYHEFWNEKTLLYIVTAFKKVACGRFNYGNKFNRKIASGMPIILPTTKNGKIDFHFMHTLINALMKQTIQGVAQYCDSKIQATKEVISQETPIQKDSLF
ncbi:restriction endonuclease subunit S [Helicobacter pylori]|uniref:restriction endonuclease subunit S n=1 Tax=Helicobacter pylori TaxID=210 RepID=UPI0019208FBD|nr:restriction endonuclease subunit S [Helicobacter pylori]QQX45881.1 restriction endonuclease subunit S [Helicobacter pylori]